MLLSTSEFTKQMLDFVATCENEKQLIYSVSMELAQHLECNVIVFDTGGDKSTHYINIDKFALIDDAVLKQLEVDSTLVNVKFNDIAKIDYIDKCYWFIVPLVYCGKKVGVTLLYKENSFKQEVATIVEIYTAFVSIIFNQINTQHDNEIERNISLVKSAIGTLSFSELEAIIQVFEELGSNEGIIIASKIASKTGITRSVIVNGLRKLESAKIIDSKSLGMKGTFVKINNQYFKKELAIAKTNFSRFS